MRESASGGPASVGGPAADPMPTSIDVRAGQRRGFFRRAARHWQALIFFAVLLGVWQLAAYLEDDLLFASFTQTLGALGRTIADGSLVRAFAASNEAFIIGYALALASGILLGLAMGRLAFVDRCTGAYLQIGLVSPLVALVPVIILLFGLSLTARCAVVFMFALPIIAFNVRAGVYTVPRDFIEMARSFGGGQIFVLRKVTLPGAMGGVVAGVWQSIGPGISGMIAAELTIVAAGLGGMETKAMGDYDAPILFAVTAVLAVEGIVLTKSARYAARRLVHGS